MKKILSILVCVCVLLSAMVFTASADSVSNVVLTVDSLGLASQSYSADTATVNGVDFEWIQLGNYGNGIQVRDNAEKGTSFFWNTSAFGAAIKEIRLVYNTSKSTYDNPDAEIFSFGNAVDSYTYSTKLSTTAGVKEYTITPDAETYTFLKFEHDLSYTMYWDSITIVLVGGESTEVTPPADDEEEDKDDTTTSTATVVDTPVAGTAYKFGMVQGNLNNTLYYITGVKGGYNNIYLATTTDAASAADVYLEETTGGYYLYTNASGSKKYINMVVSDTYVNGEVQDTASTVYTYDAESKTIVATVNDALYWFGTRNDKTYDTVGPVKTEYNGFYCQFYTVGAGEDVTPPAGGEEDTPVVLPTPDATNTLTIKEAIELGSAQEHNTYTEEKYYVTGLVISVYNDQYGNMYIVDEEGNTLTLYGTYSADGETSYGEMSSKPDEGDTVTIYGKVGQYSGTAQIKNGWIIEFTAGELEVEDTDPAADSVLSIKDAIALGESKLHNVYTENKYYITGTILEVYNEDYGNLYLVDGEGNQITVYGSWNEDGTLSYSQMETKPVAGDTVTLYGIIGQYNGTAQMKNGWFKDAPVVEGDDTTDDATTGGDNNANTDSSTTSPSTGDNVGAVVAMAIAAAAVITYTSKKR